MEIINIFLSVGQFGVFLRMDVCRPQAEDSLGLLVRVGRGMISGGLH